MRLWRRLRIWFQRDRFEADLAEEMRLHVELRTRRLEREGVEPAEARAAARRQFGSPLALRDQSRDTWVWRWLQDALQDLRFSARTFAKSAAFTVTAVSPLG